MPLVLITDANVWIDLQTGQVLADAVKLDFELVLPDVVHSELERRRPALFEELRLLVDLQHVVLGELDPSGVQLALSLGERYPRPQRPDLFSLTMAKLRKAILVTGDKHLREAAEAERVEVHGTLWLMEALVAQEVVTKRRATGALRRMLRGDRRLPESECERLMRRWGTR